MSEFEHSLDMVNERVFNTVMSKNKTYGNSYSKSATLLAILYPSIGIHQYVDAHVIIRMLDKLSRIASGDIEVEQKLDAWIDLAGYAMLAATDLIEED